MNTFNAETHEYSMAGQRVPCVSDVLKGMGFVDYSAVPPQILEAGRQFGSAVHKATELHDKGILDTLTLSEPLIPYLEGWKKFLKDYDLHYEPDEIEKHLYSAKWRFAGTPDRLPKKIGRKIILPDVKTPQESNPANELQLAAYDLLCEENLKISAHEWWVVHLNDEGTYKLTVYKDKIARNVFLASLSSLKWKLNKGVWKYGTGN